MVQKYSRRLLRGGRGDQKGDFAYLRIYLLNRPKHTLAPKQAGRRSEFTAEA